MALIIQLSNDEQAALAAKARMMGLSLEDYARQVLMRDLAPAWLQRSWQRAGVLGVATLSEEEISAEIAVARRARRDVRS